ncbi:MAG TPA: sugar transferase [Saprospiraceae bacterium]|nr:sugar transferase [Saprospiraceae bacterium]
MQQFDYYSPTGSDIASRELLFIGFDGDFDAHIYNFPYSSEDYNYAIENSPLHAMQWLESRVERIETYQMPYAIFVNIRWLIADEFRLARQLADHVDLCHVPLIALAGPGDEVDRMLLVNNRIDDCYTVPVEWDTLEQRLVYLNQYKPQLLEHKHHPVQEAGFRISPAKRLFDILAASIGIILSLPIWLPTLIAIRLESRGPVLYRSKRVGAGYHVFDFLKFRSMRVDADAMLQQVKHLNQYAAEDQSGPAFLKIANDPRVTRVGRFIRKYSIDELPQLVNVLLGDMSLVGNRPLPLYEAEQLTRDEWAARFLAPAGITGLWQVTKRGHADMSAEERIALDVRYAREYCAWTDFVILVKTFTAFVQREAV